MTTTLFFELLFICSTVTSLLTEISKHLTDKFPDNITALATGLLTGIIATAIVYQLRDIPYTTDNIICMCLMGFASSAGAMAGYDKVIQTTRQITNKNKR